MLGQQVISPLGTRVNAHRASVCFTFPVLTPAQYSQRSLRRVWTAAQPGHLACVGALQKSQLRLTSLIPACLPSSGSGEHEAGSSSFGQPLNQRSTPNTGHERHGLIAFFSNSFKVAGSVALLCLAAMGSPRGASAAEHRCVLACLIKPASSLLPARK